MNSDTRLIATALIASACSIAPHAHAQVPQEPIGARLEYQVALPDGEWESSVTIHPGERVEWRAVISFTGTQIAAALGRIYYQPIFSNVDNTGGVDEQDQLGIWRNNGISGQGNTTLQQGLLSRAEGEDSSTLASYGRVHFGFSSRSTTVGLSGALIAHRHSGGANSAPEGNYMRIAGSRNTEWYPPSIPTGTVAFNNRILWGVVSDNNARTSTWYVSGIQDMVIFRHAFVASANPVENERVVTLFSEAASLQRQGGAAGTADTRFMTWGFDGAPASTYSIRTGVEYIPATITIVPAPATTALTAVALLLSSRRRRHTCL